MIHIEGMDPERQRLAMQPSKRSDALVFPERHCHRCGAKFERKVKGKKRKPETLASFMARKYCGAACYHEAAREEAFRRMNLRNGREA